MTSAVEWTQIARLATKRKDNLDREKGIFALENNMTPFSKSNLPIPEQTFKKVYFQESHMERSGTHRPESLYINW